MRRGNRTNSFNNSRGDGGGRRPLSASFNAIVEEDDEVRVACAMEWSFCNVYAACGASHARKGRLFPTLT